MNLNKVTIAGNLTRDPEVKHLPNGTAVAAFGVAVNRRWKDANGEAKEEVTFVECSAWAKTAELIGQYFRKGSPIYVEGRLTQESWDDKTSGQKRTKTKVTVENFQFVGKREGAAAQTAPAPAMQSPEKAPASTAPETEDPDSIPF